MLPAALKSQNVYKNDHKKNFTVLGNNIIRAQFAPARATSKDVLLYALTCSKTFKFTIKSLARKFSVSEKTMQRRVTELVDLGYALRFQYRSNQGFYQACYIKFFETPRKPQTLGNRTSQPVDNFCPPVKSPPFPPPDKSPPREPRKTPVDNFCPPDTLSYREKTKEETNKRKNHCSVSLDKYKKLVREADQNDPGLIPLLKIAIDRFGESRTIQMIEYSNINSTKNYCGMMRQCMAEDWTLKIKYGQFESKTLVDVTNDIAKTKKATEDAKKEILRREYLKQRYSKLSDDETKAYHGFIIDHVVKTGNTFDIRRIKRGKTSGIINAYKLLLLDDFAHHRRIKNDTDTKDACRT